MLGERAVLNPPKGPEPPGKVDSAIVDFGVMTLSFVRGFGEKRSRGCSAFGDGGASMFLRIAGISG